LTPSKKVVKEPPLIRVGHSLARVKFWGAAPSGSGNMVFRKMRLRIGQLGS